MEAIIKGLVGVLVYINNLLIHSNTNEIKSLATTRPGLLSLTDIIQTTTSQQIQELYWNFVYSTIGVTTLLALLTSIFLY